MGCVESAQGRRLPAEQPGICGVRETPRWQIREREAAWGGGGVGSPRAIDRMGALLRHRYKMRWDEPHLQRMLSRCSAVFDWTVVQHRAACALPHCTTRVGAGRSRTHRRLIVLNSPTVETPKRFFELVSI